MVPSLCGIHAVANTVAALPPNHLSKRCSGFRYGNGIELVFLVLLVRRGVRRARKVCSAKLLLPVSRCGGRVRIASTDQRWRFPAVSRQRSAVVVDVDSVITTFQDKRFGKRLPAASVYVIGTCSSFWPSATHKRLFQRYTADAGR